MSRGKGLICPCRVLMASLLLDMCYLAASQMQLVWAGEHHQIHQH